MLINMIDHDWWLSLLIMLIINPWKIQQAKTHCKNLSQLFLFNDSVDGVDGGVNHGQLSGVKNYDGWTWLCEEVHLGMAQASPWPREICFMVRGLTHRDEQGEPGLELQPLLLFQHGPIMESFAVPLPINKPQMGCIVDYIALEVIANHARWECSWVAAHCWASLLTLGFGAWPYWYEMVDSCWQGSIKLKRLLSLGGVKTCSQILLVWLLLAMDIAEA